LVYSPLGVFMEPGRGLEHVIPFFAFAPGIRKMIYTTNAHHRARDRAAHQDAPAPVQRPRHDPPARRRRRHQDPGRQSHLPRDRHYRVSEERRHARKRRRHGEPRLDPHHAALRPPARRGEPRRGGADFDLSPDPRVPRFTRMGSHPSAALWQE
jgi:hypothetical protein